jgi:putative protein-disulfide isomerase
MDGPHLIYFSDPMCSWCYGFSPVVAGIRQAFGRALPIRLVMGGLRPGTETPMTETAKAEIKTHWEHVRDAAGLPFDGAGGGVGVIAEALAVQGRAVVRVRREDPELALIYLARAQQAFYAEGRDVTDAQVLADLAAEQGLDRDAFLADFDSEELKQETWRDYAISQRAGVTGFPTLVAGPSAEGAYGVVTRGYQPGEQILAVLHRWLEGSEAGTA